MARHFSLIVLAGAAGACAPADPQGLEPGLEPARPAWVRGPDGWPVGDCARDLEPTGHGPSDVALDFTITDQHGDRLRLHDFCDRTVLVVAAALWCGPCRRSAPQEQALFEAYAEDGLMVITLLGENASGGPPSADDVAAWVDTFELTHPVGTDRDWDIYRRFVGGPGVELPSMTLLGEGAEVLVVDEWITHDTVVEALE